MRLSVVDGQVVSEDGTVHDLLAAIAGIPWVTATQYPPPHQYVVFERCPVVAWAVLETAIAKHPDSYLAYFRGYQRPNRYWDFDGRRYWRTSSGGPGGVTHMLNRCVNGHGEFPLEPRLGLTWILLSSTIGRLKLPHVRLDRSAA